MNLQEANTLRKLDREFDLDKFSRAKRRIDLKTANETIPVIVLRSGFGYVAATYWRFHNYTAYSKIPSAAFLHLSERIQGVINKSNVLDFPAVKQNELTYTDETQEAA